MFNKRKLATPSAAAFRHCPTPHCVAYTTPMFLPRALRSPAAIGGAASLASLPAHLVLLHLMSVRLASMVLAMVGA